MSKSRGRGSFGTALGFRPNFCSNACNFARSVSGVSAEAGLIPTTALMKGGESGGQSTGVVRHDEETRMGRSESSLSRWIAFSMIWFEPPRFEPRAM
jgi:hypothetical protein